MSNSGVHCISLVGARVEEDLVSSWDVVGAPVVPPGPAGSSVHNTLLLVVKTKNLFSLKTPNKQINDKKRTMPTTLVGGEILLRGPIMVPNEKKCSQKKMRMGARMGGFS